MKRLLSLSLALLVLGACKDGPTDPDPFGGKRNYSVGEKVSFNVRSTESCTNPVTRTGRVVAVTQRAVVVADDQNPANGFTDEEYRGFGTDFDSFVYPVITGAFGAPHDIDQNGRVVIFFTKAVNELTPAGSNEITLGFFFARDLFPRKESGGLGACAGSNVAEMFYMRVPEPGKPGFSKQDVARNTLPVIGHEFQHLINASRRLFVVKAGASWDEAVWLNEGLSHVAEEILFYAASGLQPRQNIGWPTLSSSEQVRTAEVRYQRDNLARLSTYLNTPETTSPFDPSNSVSLGTRGAIWQFLRYAADRRGGSDAALWKSLVDSKQTGLENLRAAFGSDPMLLFRDWSVGVYADDAVPGVAPAFLQPSWNYRSVLAGLRADGRFPLRTRQLANGVPTGLSLSGGGAAFVRFGVPPAIRAELRTEPEGSSPSGACLQAPDLAVGEAFTAPAGQGQLLCVNGGVTGGEFTLVLFHGSEAASATLPLSVTGMGVTVAAGPPSPSLAPFAGPALSSPDGFRRDWEFEARLRDRERELSVLVPGAESPAPRVSRSAAAGPAQLMVSLVRTK